MVDNRLIRYGIRAVQLLFAIIIMGTDGYSIHIFHGHTTYTHLPEGDFYLSTGVPNAWGFLIFCAGFLVLIVFFTFICEFYIASRKWIGYVRIAAEAVAVLSWLAGFVAVAVNISTKSCSNGEKSCGPLTAATVFGALEWLLFVTTTAQTGMLVFNISHRTVPFTAQSCATV